MPIAGLSPDWVIGSEPLRETGGPSRGWLGRSWRAEGVGFGARPGSSRASSEFTAWKAVRVLCGSVSFWWEPPRWLYRGGLTGFCWARFRIGARGRANRDVVDDLMRPLARSVRELAARDERANALRWSCRLRPCRAPAVPSVSFPDPDAVDGFWLRGLVERWPCRQAREYASDGRASTAWPAVESASSSF
jgi:hypothetical protein